MAGIVPEMERGSCLELMSWDETFLSERLCCSYIVVRRLGRSRAELLSGSYVGRNVRFAMGGAVDNVIQRVIAFLISIPVLPFWMALSATLPPKWSPVYVYFGIATILSIGGWTGLARVVRGKLLELREEDFATAANFPGTRVEDHRQPPAPFLLEHLIVSLTLSVPNMILDETSLSFGAWYPSFGGQLGTLFRGFSACEKCHTISLALHTGAVCCHCCACLQFSGRRTT